MAKIKKTTSKSGKSSKVGKKKVGKKRVKADNIQLPTKKTKPHTNLASFSWLIYGHKKIGKTSLSAQFTKGLIYSFEAGTKSLEVFQVDIKNWDDAKAYNEKLFSGEHDFENVILDTGDITYKRCEQDFKLKNKVDSPADLPWGKGWSMLSDSFDTFHTDILANGLGLIILAHDTIHEEETASGMKKFTTKPVLSNRAMNYYTAVVDTIAHYQFIGDKRFLQIRKDNENIECGTRLRKNFLTPSGKRIIRIPMGENEEEAYANLLLAFNNKQEKTYANSDAIMNRRSAPKKNLKKKKKKK